MKNISKEYRMPLIFNDQLFKQINDEALQSAFFRHGLYTKVKEAISDPGVLSFLLEMAQQEINKQKMQFLEYQQEFREHKKSLLPLHSETHKEFINCWYEINRNIEKFIEMQDKLTFLQIVKHDKINLPQSTDTHPISKFYLDTLNSKIPEDKLSVTELRKNFLKLFLPLDGRTVLEGSILRPLTANVSAILRERITQNTNDVLKETQIILDKIKSREFENPELIIPFKQIKQECIRTQLEKTRKMIEAKCEQFCKTNLKDNTPPWKLGFFGSNSSINYKNTAVPVPEGIAKIYTILTTSDLNSEESLLASAQEIRNITKSKQNTGSFFESIKALFGMGRSKETSDTYVKIEEDLETRNDKNNFSF